MKTRIYKQDYNSPEISIQTETYLDMLCLSGGIGGTEGTYDDPWTKSGYNDLVF